MRIAISGGTGFVAAHLVPKLQARGDEVTLLVRPESRVKMKSVQTARIDADDALDGMDAVINLAGAGVMDKRWSDERLRVIRDSRIDTTRMLVGKIKDARVLVSASAIGYYGAVTDDIDRDESSAPGDDVLARICVDWETEALRAKCRVAIPRIGIALGREGGALASMIPLFKKFVGGPLGDGKQWCSWIHVDDLVKSILFAIDTSSFEGPFNATTNSPVRMNELAKTLGEVMHRPSFFRAPAIAMHAALGGAADVVLKGVRVLPKKLDQAGFVPDFATLRDALAACV